MQNENKKHRVESIKSLENKAIKLESLIRLSNDLHDKEGRTPITFNDFLYITSDQPEIVLRDIFQLFHDMVVMHIAERDDEYQSDDDHIGFVPYDCSKLFIEDVDEPFFADRLFSNRFMNLVRSFKKGIQNNRIYLFEGPPGSGKSTFLNNLLLKLERFCDTPQGSKFNTLWRLDVEKLGGFHSIERTINRIAEEAGNQDVQRQYSNLTKPLKYVDIPCPNHDHPILQIPKAYRKNFLEELIPDEKFKEKLFNSREYEWVLKEIPCGICNSIYNSLLDEIGVPIEVFNMLYARKILYSRQFGEGISIFNPGDPIIKNPIENPTLQKLINELLKNDSVQYRYSYLANTNNGVYALMDIKENNIERMMRLHSIISDGVHKVGLIEERIKSLFLGLINPEDKKHYEDVKSFQDRIITINIPYILDYNTEVSIYKNKFGENLDHAFLPRILDNFAKIIISTRLEKDSTAVRKWIGNPSTYKKYVDNNLFLLKMQIYTGMIPTWLNEADLKAFDRKTRQEVLADSENEGKKGISGRQSLSIFNTFLSKHSKSGKLITMKMLTAFFESKDFTVKDQIPEGFIKSLVDLYDYNILQEVKESVYYYNEAQISKDILNYIYCTNFDEGDRVNCVYSGDQIDVNEEFFKNFEALFVGTTSTIKERKSFRKDILTEYITVTLSQEINVKGKKIEQTALYESLFNRYTRNLKENTLAPYFENENFRRAIQDFGSDQFKSYDKRIKGDVNHLLVNLQKKFKYSEEGARQVCLYVLDKKLVGKY